MRVMQLRNLLTASYIPKLITRHYSFTVNLTVKSIDSIEIAADKTFGPNRKVNVKVYDSNGTLQDGTLLNAVQREDGFFMNYNRSGDDKLVLSLPLTAKLNEYDVRVQGEKSNVNINNLVMKSLKIDVSEGDVDLQSVRLENVEVNTANNINVSGLFGSNLDKIHLNSSNGTIEVNECRCSEFVLNGKIVKVFNCFNSLNKIKSSLELIIQNLLGCTTIEAIGEKTRINGIVGTLKAMLGARSNEMEILMLQTDDNELILTNPEAKTNLAFSNRMASKLTKILIDAKPETITQTNDDITLDRINENLFEIVRTSGGDGDSVLSIKMIAGREIQLHKQSWLDTFSFFKNLFKL